MPTTRLYFNDSAAPYTPATLKGAWDNSGGSVTRLLISDKRLGGTAQYASQFVTYAADYDKMLVRGVSHALPAQTITGSVNLMLGVFQETAARDVVYHLHIYVTQGDSDIVRGTLLTDYIDPVANEWPNGSAAAVGQALSASQTLTAVAVTAGDRLVVEAGYRALVAGTSVNHGMAYGGSGADLTAGGSVLLPGWIEFSDLAAADARVSQLVMEAALQQTAASDARVSQLVVEGAIQQTASTDARVSQLVLEVAVATYNPTPVATGRSQVVIVG